MPNELAFELDGFDLHVTDFADDPWIRVIREAAEFFLAGSVNLDPANFTEIEFDAVHVFAADYRPIQQFFQLATGEICDGFFLLAGLYFEIDAAVMIFAKFRMQRADQLA